MPIRPEQARAKLLPYVHRLLGWAQLGTDGAVSWPVFPEHEMSTAVLSGNMQRLPQMPDDEALVAQCVHRALIALKRQANDEPTWEQFLEAFHDAADDENAKPRGERLVLFFLHLRGPWLARKRFVVVQNTQFRKRSWAQVRRFPGWRDFLAEARNYGQMGDRAELSLTERFTPFAVKVYSRTADEAIGLAEPKFEMLRASVNLVKRYGTWTWQGGRPQPLGVCLPPPVYGIFGGDGSYETLYTSDVLYEYRRPEDYELDRGRRVERLISQVNGLRDAKVRHLIVDLLLKYGQAMDTTDWRSAFLALWQILEAASLRTVHKELRTEDVRRRVLSLVHYRQVVEDVLDLLIEDRNALVHEGRFSEQGLQRVNHLKPMAENTILALLEKLRRYPDLQSLEEYYCQAPEAEKALRLRQRVMRDILRH